MHGERTVPEPGRSTGRKALPWRSVRFEGGKIQVTRPVPFQDTGTGGRMRRYGESARVRCG